MNEFDLDNTDDPTRGECAEARGALHRLLDGEAAWDTPTAAAHRGVCTACREELLLASMLPRDTAPEAVPAALTSHIMATVVAAHRRRRLSRVAAVALATAAGIVVAVVAFRPPARTEPTPVVVVPQPQVDPQRGLAKPLGESVNEATAALENLARRTANDTREQTTRLLPEPKLPETPGAAEGLDGLADAGAGAARSVEPMRNSARRAFNLFLRAADPPDRPQTR